MSALEHPVSPAGDADADASVAGPAAVRPRRSSWELLLWLLSAALVATGAALLWQASVGGSFDTTQPVSTIRMDPETGRVISCESQGGPCSWTLATDGLAYALALPALGSGTTGLLLGVALRARRATHQPQQQPESGRDLPQEARHQPDEGLQPGGAPATRRAAPSLRNETTASFAPFMPPGQQPAQQPGDDPAHR